MNDISTKVRFGRRAFLGGMGGAAVAFALASCSGTSGSGTTGAASGYAQPAGSVPAEYAKRQRIVAWHRWTSNNGQAMKELADRFNKAQTKVYLDMQPQPGTYDNLSAKVATALQAKAIPDLVAFSEVTWHQFFLNQTLEPLDKYFSNSFSKSDLNSQLLAHGVLSGNLYWVPIAESTPLFFYNKDLLKQAGLPAAAPETWTDLRSLGAKLKDVRYNGNSPKLIAFKEVDGDWDFQGVLWNFGGGISDGLDVIINNDKSVAAGAYRQDLVYKDQMAYMTSSTQNDFENGLIAFHEDSSGALTTIMENSKFDVGTGFVPMEEHRAVPTGGGGYSIMSAAPEDRKKAAFEFIKFLCEPEQAAFWSASSGYLPLNDKAKKDPVLTAAVAKYPGFQTLFDQAKYSRKEDAVALFVPNASPTIYDGLQAMLSKNAPVKATLDAVAQQLTTASKPVEAQYKKLVK